jgi:hypothetical protein
MEIFRGQLKLLLLEKHFLSLSHTIDDSNPLLREKGQAAKVVMTLNFMAASN